MSHQGRLLQDVPPFAEARTVLGPRPETKIWKKKKRSPP